MITEIIIIIISINSRWRWRENYSKTVVDLQIRQIITSVGVGLQMHPVLVSIPVRVDLWKSKFISMYIPICVDLVCMYIIGVYYSFVSCELLSFSINSQQSLQLNNIMIINSYIQSWHKNNNNINKQIMTIITKTQLAHYINKSLQLSLWNVMLLQHTLRQTWLAATTVDKSH